MHAGSEFRKKIGGLQRIITRVDLEIPFRVNPTSVLTAHFAAKAFAADCVFRSSDALVFTPSGLGADDEEEIEHEERDGEVIADRSCACIGQALVGRPEEEGSGEQSGLEPVAE